MCAPMCGYVFPQIGATWRLPLLIAYLPPPELLFCSDFGSRGTLGATEAPPPPPTAHLQHCPISNYFSSERESTHSPTSSAAALVAVSVVEKCRRPSYNYTYCFYV